MNNKRRARRRLKKAAEAGAKRAVTYVLYVDGGVIPGVGVYFSVRRKGQKGGNWVTRQRSTLHVTSMEAEYLAVIHGLVKVLEVSTVQPAATFEVKMHSDSRMIVEQIRGEQVCKSPYEMPLLKRVQILVSEIQRRGGTFEIAWTPRANIVKELFH